MFQVRQPNQADKGDRDPHDVPADLFAERPLRADKAVFLPQLSPCARIVRIIDPEGEKNMINFFLDCFDTGENVAIRRAATIRQRWVRAVLQFAEICHGFTVISPSLRPRYVTSTSLSRTCPCVVISVFTITCFATMSPSACFFSSIITSY